MTQTISTPEETSTSWRQPAVRSHERRTTLRKAPEQLIYLSLPSNNGGIVLDVSDGGLGFHSIAPVDQDGPIHFRFAIDSGAKIRGVGEIAWIDKTGKTGGLRFTQLPDELRKQIRLWTGQPKSIDAITSTQNDGQSGKTTSSAPSETPVFPSAVSTPRFGAAPVKKFKYSMSAEGMEPVSEQAAAPALETRLGVASMAGTLVAEPVKQTRIADEPSADLPSIWETRNPLLYNSTPPIYSAPFNRMSLFPLNPGVEAEAAAARMRELARGEKPLGALESAARMNPLRAIVLTILLAFLVTVGILTYLSTSGVGELLLNLGQEISGGSQSHPALQNPAPLVNSAPGSSTAGGR
jgi:hypothetical protein